MPNFNKANEFSQSFNKKSPFETRLGRWLMGRKKHKTSDGGTVITDKSGRVVKSKTAKGVKKKYKKGNRPHAVIMKYGGKTEVQYNK
jgi:hypothetical protein